MFGLKLLISVSRVILVSDIMIICSFVGRLILSISFRSFRLMCSVCSIFMLGVSGCLC